MSLLGRLEDLPISDILQIVFLSRRTGILEVVRGDATSQVLFQKGLIVGARSSEVSGLSQELLEESKLTADQIDLAVRAASREPVTPLGTTLTELGLISPEDLGEAILAKIRRVIEPLIGCEEGEFNFILREALEPVEIEYAPEEVFRDRGVPPQKILARDGEKIVPLKALQDQMRSGKILMSQRGMSVDARREVTQPLPPPPSGAPKTVEPPPPVADAPASLPPPEPSATSAAPPHAPVSPDPVHPYRPTIEFAEVAPTDDDLAAIGPLQLDEPAEAPPSMPQVAVIVAGGEEERRRAFEERSVVIFESDPLLRVAAKRVLGKHGIRAFHFNDGTEVYRTLRELFEQNRFFVTVVSVSPTTTLETIASDDGARILDWVRKLGRGYPAVAVLPREDHRMRRELYRIGADVVTTKPPAMPGAGAAAVEAELAGFGEELALLAERYHDAWERAGSMGEEERPAASTGPIVELGRRERGRRTLSALKHLIAELAGTTEVSEVASMILRVAAESLERGVLFLVGTKEFIGLGGFGATGDGVPMNLRVRRIRIPAGEPCIFSEVRRTRRMHKGKLKKTDWNQKLISQLGTIYPNEVVAIPVVNRDKILAIVYGDNARDKVPIGEVDGLEIFLAQAGYAFEAALVAGRKRRSADDTADGARARPTGELRAPIEESHPEGGNG